jgi:hypothetical protein
VTGPFVGAPLIPLSNGLVLSAELFSFLVFFGAAVGELAG